MRGNAREQRILSWGLLIAHVALLLFSHPSVSSAEYIPYGAFDGTVALSSDTYLNGMEPTNTSASNHVFACAAFQTELGLPSGNGSGFVLAVQMGAFTDYYVPVNASVDLCTLLCSHPQDGVYRFSAHDPLAEDWDGFTTPVKAPAQWSGALGGAPLGFLSVDRAAPSFWGDDSSSSSNSSSGNGAVRGGGCCYAVPRAQPMWFQPLNLSVAVVDSDRLFLTWLVQPVAVVVGAPLLFTLNIWNYAGALYSEALSLRLSFNGSLTTVVSTAGGRSNPGRAVVEQDLSSMSLSTEDLFNLTVEVLEPAPPSLRTRRLALLLPVLPPLPAGLTSCTADNIPTLLQLGAGAAFPVPNRESLLSGWQFFAGGGLASLHPLEGQESVVLLPPLPASGGQRNATAAWTARNASATGGVFTSALPAASATPGAEGAVQFFALSLYSAAAQTAVVYVFADDTAELFLDGALAVPASSFFYNAKAKLFQASLSVTVSQGYHQVLVAQYSPYASSSSSTSSSSSLEVKFMGTGLAYALEAPVNTPDGSYELSSGSPLLQYLHSGARRSDGFVYSAKAAADDFLPVDSAVLPAEGDYVNRTAAPAMRWTAITYGNGGRVLAQGPDAGSSSDTHAVSFISFALYNPYDVPREIGGVLGATRAGAAATVYLDGTAVFATSSGDGGGGNEVAEGAAVAHEFSLTLSPSWSQVIVRLIAEKGTAWYATLSFTFSGFRVLVATSMSDRALPPGVQAAQPGVPVASMMALTRTQAEGGEGDGGSALVVSRRTIVLYDVTNRTESADTFLPFALSGEFIDAAQAVAIAGSQQVYRWQAAGLSSSSGGRWGGSTGVGGAFSRYWAFTLLVAGGAGAAEVGFTIEVEGGAVSLWVDQAPLGTVAAAATPPTLWATLAPGWHQVLVKLRADDNMVAWNSHTVASSGELQSWAAANKECQQQSAGAASLCGSEAYCPFGQPRPGRFAEAQASPSVVYAPVRNAAEEWIQLSASSSSGAPLCSLANRTDANTGALFPSFPLTQYAACCTSSDPALMTLALALAPAAAGPRVGHSYTRVLSIAAVSLSVTRPTALTQTVIASCATPGARARYQMPAGTSGGWTAYSGPLTVTASVAIAVQCYLDTDASLVRTLQVTVPTFPSASRAACVSGAPCPLAMGGVDPGWLVALLLRSVEESGEGDVLNRAFVESLRGGDRLLGMEAVSAQMLAVFDSTGGTAEPYIMVVFPPEGPTGTRVDAFLRFYTASTTSVAPLSVAAAERSVLTVSGGAFSSSTDAVAFPEVWNGKSGGSGPRSESCAAQCSALSGPAAWHFASASSSSSTSSAIVELNLTAFAGDSVSCLCVCLSCRQSAESSELRGDMNTSSFVVAVPIFIRVLWEATPPHPGNDNDGDSYKGKYKLATGLAVTFGVLLLLLVVAVVVGVACVVRRRRRLLALRNQSLQQDLATMLDDPTPLGKGFVHFD